MLDMLNCAEQYKFKHEKKPKTNKQTKNPNPEDKQNNNKPTQMLNEHLTQEQNRCTYNHAEKPEA